MGGRVAREADRGSPDILDAGEGHFGRSAGRSLQEPWVNHGLHTLRVLVACVRTGMFQVISYGYHPVRAIVCLNRVDHSCLDMEK